MTSNKGDIDKICNRKLESFLNVFGVRGTASKLGVSVQGLYKNLHKRGFRSKKVYVVKDE